MRRSRKSMPDYGIDAPNTGLITLLLTATLLLGALLLYLYGAGAAKTISYILFLLAATGMVILFLIWMYVRHEKLRLRDRMLNMLAWTGDEDVLDVGTGRGLLLIGAAKRLTTGKCIGIDIWRREDLTHNHPAAVITNAKLEEVKDKITVLHADARNMPLANSSFDYVLSNLCLHNIRDKEERIKAVQEIIRVLKPGGTALIADVRHTKEYAAECKKQGLETTRLPSPLIAPVLMHIVKAVKRE
jgi:ubiquinone/menaquinone biosynthesis C-methylase UbiE